MFTADTPKLRQNFAMKIFKISVVFFFKFNEELELYPYLALIYFVT